MQLSKSRKKLESKTWEINGLLQGLLCFPLLD